MREDSDPDPRLKPRTIPTQAYLDLAARARDGVFVHLPLWLLIGVGGDLWRHAPSIYWGHATLFALALALRLKFEQRFAWLAEKDAWARRAFIALLLSNSLHWGFLATQAAIVATMHQVQIGIWFAAIAIAAAGGMSLIIEPFVRRAYPLLAIAPVSVALFFRIDQVGIVLPAMAAVFVVYIHRASRVVREDYWRAFNAQLKLQQRASDLEKLSTTDGLTSVNNRAYFDRQLVNEWERAIRSGEPLALLMIDLDHFKNINDVHGHAAGDACLKAAAAALQGELKRPSDFLARYGGEEFCILLPDTELQGAALLAQRICNAVSSSAVQYEDKAIRLTCSIGIHAAPLALALPHRQHWLSPMPPCMKQSDEDAIALSQVDQAITVRSPLSWSRRLCIASTPVGLAGHAGDRRLQWLHRLHKGVTSAQCMVHARRKFNDLWANHRSEVGRQALR